MTKSFRRPTQRFAALAMAVALSLAWAPASQADPLGDTKAAVDDAKAAGYVGEQRNGFLGLVNSDAPAKIVDLVKSVNNLRKDQYIAIAQKAGTGVSAVAKLAGEKFIETTATGNYVQNASGGWEKKK